MSDEMIDEYGASIGSVMAARKDYETICAAEGADSHAAQQAHEHLSRQLQHRETMRERHDAAPSVHRGEARRD